METAGDLNKQNRDLELLLRLYARLANRVVIDVGAERGVFVDAFLAAGCPRVYAFEPYPPHARHLRDRFRGSDIVRRFEMALGAQDHAASLHIAEDKWGQEYDFYHSLVDFVATREVRWGRTLSVPCRSLASLVDDGTLPSEVGVLKIGTEGYDLEVVRGMGRLSSSIVMVEYWDTLPTILGPCPYSLREVGEVLRSRGFSNALVIKRHDGFEALQLGSLATRPGDWGNAIFVHDRLYPDLSPLLHDAAVEAQTKLIDTATELRTHGEQCLRIIAEQRERRIGRWRRRWLRPRIGTLRHHPPRPLAIPAWYRRPGALAAPPVISIVTPVLNSRRFLERTVRSVLDQEYPKLEYVAQDGGSTDGSVAILERYGSALASIEVVKDHGQADAINRGFARTTGEIMAYLNGDDLLLPGALDCVAEFLARHPDVDVVYGHRVLIDEHDEEIGRWVLPPHDPAVLSWADYVPQETLFWRRRIWERVGARLDDTFHFAMDWDLMLRFRAAGGRFRRIPRFLGAFRVHDGQKSSALINDIGASEMARLRQREHGRPIGQAELSRRLRGFLLRHIVYQKLYRLGLLRY